MEATAAIAGIFEQMGSDIRHVFLDLQAHANEFKCFDKQHPDPGEVTGVFKVNGNGEVRVALDLTELRRAKIVNFRSTLDKAHAILTEAGKQVEDIIGAKPLTDDANARLQQAVEDGWKEKAQQ